MAQSDFTMRVRAIRKNNFVLVRAWIQHPMHSGIATDEHGTIATAHYITRVELLVDGVVCVRADLGPGISRNPLLGWRLAEVAAGARIGVAWQDNLGLSGSQQVTAT